MKLYNTLLFLAFTLILFSCKKNSTNSNSPVQLLTQQSWKLTAQRWNLNNSGWLDSYQNQPVCRRDNIITYYSDFNLINDEGPTKCNSLDPQIFKTATWNFFSNNSKILITEAAGTFSYEILQLDTQTLKLLYKDSSAQQISLSETTFSH